MGLVPNRLCDENSKFRAKISKRDDAYLAKIRQGAVCNLQPKFRICSRSLLGRSPNICPRTKARGKPKGNLNTTQQIILIPVSAHINSV